MDCLKKGAGEKNAGSGLHRHIGTGWGGGLPTVPPISGTISVRVGGGRNRYRGMVTLDRASDPELSNSDNA